MATAEQKIFKKIVLHNKLLNEATVDRLLAKLPDPELAVKYLVKREKLTAKKAGQLLTLYHKQLEKHLGNGGDSHVLTDNDPDRPLSAYESFDAMFDDIVSSDSSITAEPPAEETPAETPVESVSAEHEEATATAVETQPVETPSPVTPSVGEAEDRLSVDVADELEEETSATDTDTAGSAPPQKVSEEEDLPVLQLDTDDEEEEHDQQATAEPAAEPAVEPAAEPA
ncbi:MAG: hypothetical protein OES79_12900, partial [Planctomycetota bacterium]|nr:hypothetical protein [Planctomycetota bacterium]